MLFRSTQFVLELLQQYQSYTNVYQFIDGYIKCVSCYSKEIEFIAKELNLSFLQALFVQLIYEFNSACTVSIMNINGDNFYFRTMDWEMEFLKNITIKLNIIKDDKIIGTAVTWLGYVGFLTCQVNNDYKIAINYRRTKIVNFVSIMGNFTKITSGYWPIGYVVRDVLEKQLKYNEAVEVLQNINLISPCYITIYSYNDKSVIITRNSTNVEYIRFDNLVQTNCDYNESEPNILYSCERRELVKKLESEFNSNNITNYDDIIKKLLVFQILNRSTIYVDTEYKGEPRTFIY